MTHDSSRREETPSISQNGSPRSSMDSVGEEMQVLGPAKAQVFGEIPGPRQRSFWMRNPYSRIVIENPAFRGLFLSVAVSELGVWFTYLACLRLIGLINPSAWALTGYSLVFLLSQVLFSNVSGVIADRKNRFDVLLVTIGARALIVPVYAAVQDNYALILLVTFVHSTLESATGPCQSGLIPRLVPKRDVPIANSVLSTTWCVQLFVGSALGGLAASALPPLVCFSIDSATYLLGFFMLLRARNLDPSLGFAETHTLLEDQEDEEMGSSQAGAVLLGVAGNTVTAGGGEVGWSSVSQDDGEALAGEVASEDLEMDEAAVEAAMADKTPLVAAAASASAGMPNKEVRGSSFWEDTRFVMAFLWSHKYILVVVSCRALGSFVWGNTDLLNIMLIKTRLPADVQSITLGAVFAIEGVCIGIGPVVVMHYARHSHSIMRRCISFGFLFVAVGLALMPGLGDAASLETNIALLYAGNALKAVGMGMTAMVCDTVLLLIVDNSVMGRVTGWKWILRHGSNVITLVSSAAAIDQGGLSAETLQYVMASIASVFFALTIGYFVHLDRTKQARLDAGLKALADMDVEDEGEGEADSQKAVADQGEEIEV